VNKIKFRHEIKHYINSADCLLLQRKLRCVMEPDLNGGPDGSYLIRSLYFDTPENKALMEKIDGVDNREKIRIRLYNHDDSLIKLEKKMKVNGLTAKLSVNISKEQCKDILDGNIKWMKDTDNPVLIEIYHKMMHQHLRPRTIVDYTRNAYVYSPGNVRVTIDKSIRTGLMSNDLFSRELPTVETLPKHLAVLEVKYDEFLPEVIGDILQIGDRQKLSVSKYALCRMYY